jgi:chromosome partitioning protein
LTGLNKDVILVDGDSKQSSSSEWWAERKLSQPERPKINCVQKFGDLDETLLDLNKRYEIVLVDTPGRGESDEMNSALQVCDTILMPFKPSSFDLKTLRNMSRILKDSKRTNPKLDIRATLSMAQTRPGNKEIGWARDTIAGYPEISLLNTMIFDRQIYRDSILYGLGVTEMEGQSSTEINSRREILGLIAEVMPNV